MYGSSTDNTAVVKISALSLGFLEDFVCTTYFATALWMFGTLKQMALERLKATSGMSLKIVGEIANFTVSWLLFLGVMAPCIADMMLVVYRDMRFSFSLVASLIRERENISKTLRYPVMKSRWANLALWNPTQLVLNPVTIGKSSKNGAGGVKYKAMTLEDGTRSTDNALKKATEAPTTSYQALRAAVVILGLVVEPALAVAVRIACTPLVVYTGLNMTLNELLLHIFEPAPMEVELANLMGDGPWVEKFIDKAEEHERFGDDTRFRRTAGFKGELAFNVTIDNDNPPNVLIIGVESFRYRDSRYLVGEEDPSNLFKGTNLTITPPMGEARRCPAQYLVQYPHESLSRKFAFRSSSVSQQHTERVHWR
ncbi:hypothetical protein GN958_ATG08642 [Phytophthora infestans]|uniref:Uncharacterized protein n=1 Tax=Phytophthora infestans TaxID=4787 RepID=A0A8S9UMV1_PHYIN|nr:hypothetical protein GN958_ATG08642 [Phytophthora infestans]